MARTCRENCKLPRAGLRSAAHCERLSFTDHGVPSHAKEDSTRKAGRQRAKIESGFYGRPGTVGHSRQPGFNRRPCHAPRDRQFAAEQQRAADGDVGHEVQLDSQCGAFPVRLLNNGFSGRNRNKSDLSIGVALVVGMLRQLPADALLGLRCPSIVARLLA